MACLIAGLCGFEEQVLVMISLRGSRTHMISDRLLMIGLSGYINLLLRLAQS